jgi:DNA (cytosine-5)-methyltransferase 1
MKAADLFAGLGGFTEGAEAAGVRVVWAANHWQVAVDYHELNHPNVQHKCQDLQQADWSQVPRHDLMLASPSCTGHSPAKGREQPRHDAARSTAWAVVSCAEVHSPAVILVENVVRFTKWKLYPAWCAALHALRYARQMT